MNVSGKSESFIRNDNTGLWDYNNLGVQYKALHCNYLTKSMLGTNVGRQHLELFFLFFSENRL